jgi:hypothetical protein
MSANLPAVVNPWLHGCLMIYSLGVSEADPAQWITPLITITWGRRPPAPR